MTEVERDGPSYIASRCCIAKTHKAKECIRNGKSKKAAKNVPSQTAVGKAGVLGKASQLSGPEIKAAFILALHQMTDVKRIPHEFRT